MEGPGRGPSGLGIRTRGLPCANGFAIQQMELEVGRKGVSDPATVARGQARKLARFGVWSGKEEGKVAGGWQVGQPEGCARVEKGMNRRLARDEG